jgi:hypothetical protein
MDMRNLGSQFANAGRLLILAAVMLVAASAHAASVTVALGKAQAGNGDDVTIPVSVKGASKLASMQMDLVYDPAMLQAGKIDNGALLAENCLVESNTAPSGRARFALVSKDGISGDGVLLNVHFTVRPQASGTSALKLENVRVWALSKGQENTQGVNRLVDVMANIEPGEVAISTGLPRWIIGAAVAAVLLLIIVVFVVRRRASRA